MAEAERPTRVSQVRGGDLTVRIPLLTASIVLCREAWLSFSVSDLAALADFTSSFVYLRCFLTPFPQGRLLLSHSIVRVDMKCGERFPFLNRLRVKHVAPMSFSTVYESAASSNFTEYPASISLALVDALLAMPMHPSIFRSPNILPVCSIRSPFCVESIPPILCGVRSQASCFLKSLERLDYPEVFHFPRRIGRAGRLRFRSSA